MSQKKPTTNQQLEEMRAMIANLKPGKVITLNPELQQRNTTLMLMLYGAVAKHGIGTRGDDGVLVTAQVPVLQVPANQSLEWAVSADGKSVMLYIVLSDSSEEDRPDNAETSPANPGEGGTVRSDNEASQPTPKPDNLGEPIEVPHGITEHMAVDPAAPVEAHVAVGPEVVNETIGDEFEDPIEVMNGD